MNVTTNKCIIMSILIYTLNVSVSYAEKDMPCPSIDIIHTSAPRLDTALIIKNKYIAYTSTSVFQADEVWWFAGVGDISADTASEAIKIGKTALARVNIQIDIFATKVGSEYICNYGPGYIQARGKYF